MPLVEKVGPLIKFIAKFASNEVWQLLFSEFTGWMAR